MSQPTPSTEITARISHDLDTIDIAAAAKNWSVDEKLYLVCIGHRSLILFSKIYAASTSDDRTQIRARANDLGIHPDWRAIEAVGRGCASDKMLYPRRSKVLFTLSPEDQERIIDPGVEVTVGETDKHEPEKKMVKWDDMTSDQRAQVLAGDRLRSPLEQLRWLKNRLPAAVTPDKPDYRRVGQGKNMKVFFLSPSHGWTKAELLALAIDGE